MFDYITHNVVPVLQHDLATRDMCFVSQFVVEHVAFCI